MDAKGLGLGAILVSLVACPAAPERPDRDAPFHDFDSDGFSEDEGDCDDGDAAISPDGIEACNGIDDDCDESTDEEVAGAPVWYADADGDGYGLDTTATAGCAAPAGGTWVARGGDCDDSLATGASRYPGVTWYADDDGDGFGDPTTSADCAPARANDVTNGTDCDDTDPTEKPGVTWHADADGDGFGNPTSARVCDRAAPTDVLDATDCDDGDPTEKPGVTWYADADGDEFGDADSSRACSRAAPTDVLDATDCDDTPGTGANRFPGNPSPVPGDGQDDDCDAKDECFADDDEDGFGATTVVADALGDGCKKEQEESATDDDCADGDATIFPGSTALDPSDPADEDCDGKAECWVDADHDGYGTASAVTDAADDGCNTAQGESALGGDCDDTPGTGATYSPATPWHLDADGDTFGAGAPTAQCAAPSGAHVLDATDCDDAVGTGADTWPGNPNATVGDGDDDDCDANLRDECWPDGDGDGYGVATTRQQDVGTAGCAAADHQSAVSTDCDDAVATGALRNPGKTDVCNGIDDDCSGDESNATDADTWYNDADDDGWGTGSSYKACGEPDKAASQAGDCADGDEFVNPGRTEVCRNGKDDDCDGPADCELRGTFDYPYSDKSWAVQLAGYVASGTPPDFGWDLVRGGDSDGDGKEEFVVSAPNMANGQGRVFVIENPPSLGSPGPGSYSQIDDSDRLWARRLTRYYSDGFGMVLGVGDVTGDGKADALAWQVGTYVYSDLLGTTQLSMGPPHSVTTALTPFEVLGDVNGDGDDEVAFRMITTGNYVVRIYNGGPTLGDTEASRVEIDGGSPTGRFGEVIASLDANDDGLADIAIGDPSRSVSQSGDGAVFLYPGTITGYPDTTLAHRILHSPEANGQARPARGRSKDVDDDGYDDLLVIEQSFTPALHGVVRLVAGPLLCPVDQPACSIPQVQSTTAIDSIAEFVGENGRTIQSAAFAGDVNGDGEEDFVFGAPATDARVYLVYGPVSGTVALSGADAIFRRNGSPNTDYFFGTQVVGLGDVNGDGYDDIGVTAPWDGGGAHGNGEVFVFRGNGL